MAIEMVSFPIEHVGSFHTYISLPEKYTPSSPMKSPQITIPSPLNHHSITINYDIENPLIFFIPQKNPQWRTVWRTISGWRFQPL